MAILDDNMKWSWWDLGCGLQMNFALVDFWVFEILDFWKILGRKIHCPENQIFWGFGGDGSGCKITNPL